MDVVFSAARECGEEKFTAIEWLDPRELLHPDRLDIAVKAMYANAILGRPTNHSGISAEENYLKHIQFRTGGKEPGDELRKGSLASFKQQFIDLVLSMQKDGFLEKHPIPVARRTGIILNGAHRLAAALSLGISKVPVVFQDDVDGATWNCDWFIMQGFAANAIDEFTRTWVSLKGDFAGCIILWPTVEAHWKSIEDEIQNTTPIVYRRTIELTPFMFAELMRDIYATDWGPVPGENIERKIKFLANYPSRLRFLVVGQKDTNLLTQLKNQIRDKYKDIVEVDRFATLHTTDKVNETNYIADLLLNRANVTALKYRPKEGFRPLFLNWISQYHQQLKQLNIDPQLCCIVGSGVLEAYGVRLATDIDFTVTHQIRNTFFTPGVTHLTSDLDVVALDYPRAKVGFINPPSDDDLIKDRALHILVRGLKFANLDVVITRKQTQRRFKDMMDIALVGKREFES